MPKHIMFYGQNDWGNFWDWDRVYTLLKKETLKLEEILELYEAKKMMVCFNTDLKRADRYKNMLKEVNSRIYREFPNIDNKNLVLYFNTIGIKHYRENYFIIIEKKKCFKSLTKDIFKDLSRTKGFYISYILSCKNLLDLWGEEIFNYLLKKPNIIPVVMTKYTNPKEFKKNWYLPAEIDNEKSWEHLIEKYVSLPDANVNFLKNIIETPNIERFKLSDKLRYKAQTKINRIQNEYFLENKHELNTYKYEVIFSNKEEWRKEEYRNKTAIITLSKNWILNNLDYPTLLNNFIYLFGLTDLYARSSLVSLEAHSSIFEKTFSNWNTYSFKNNIYFQTNFLIQQMQMKGYYGLLRSENIYIEEIIGWFFNVYLPQEFKVEGFKYVVPNNNSSFLEKCRNLFIELDSIIKQFDLFASEKNIDWSFLNFKSTPIDIGNVKSFIPRKYVYLTQKGKSISKLLFSDQCFISVQVPYKVNNLYNGILKNNISYDEIEYYDKDKLDFLYENKIVSIDNRKNISLNKDIVSIIRCIYKFGEYEPYYIKSSRIKPILKILEEKEIIRYGSTLLSEPEIDFYYYICNGKKFSNGLELRNKYLHGSTNYSEEENENNFYIILLITIQIIIRMNEEFCWWDSYGRKE